MTKCGEVLMSSTIQRALLASHTRFPLKALTLSVLLTLGNQATAQTTGGQVTSGNASINTSGSTTNITQTSQNATINWDSFSIGSGETVNFMQPSSSAMVLNRVLGQDPSTILGNLNANGQVFIINPNGTLFGSTAQVNVGGLTVSSLNISDDDFNSGNYQFNNDGTAGNITNQGNLNAAEGGYIALIAPKVINEGNITANSGSVLMAAGDQVTLNLNNGSLLGYSVDQGSLDALADNKQLIQADGGQIILTAKAADALSTAVVNNSGIIQARTVQNVGGVIKLMGDMDVGTVNVSGTVNASVIIFQPAVIFTLSGNSLTKSYDNNQGFDATINSYGTSSVSGSSSVGGLVGYNTGSGTSNREYSGSNYQIGELVAGSGGGVLTLAGNTTTNTMVTVTGTTSQIGMSKGGDGGTIRGINRHTVYSIPTPSVSALVSVKTGLSPLSIANHPNPVHRSAMPNDLAPPVPPTNMIQNGIRLPDGIMLGQ